MGVLLVAGVGVQRLLHRIGAACRVIIHGRQLGRRNFTGGIQLRNAVCLPLFAVRNGVEIRCFCRGQGLAQLFGGPLGGVDGSHEIVIPVLLRQTHIGPVRGQSFIQAPVLRQIGRQVFSNGIVQASTSSKVSTWVSRVGPRKTMVQLALASTWPEPSSNSTLLRVGTDSCWSR